MPTASSTTRPSIDCYLRNQLLSDIPKTGY